MYSEPDEYIDLVDSNSDKNISEQSPGWARRLFYSVASSVGSKKLYIVLTLLIVPSLWCGFIADDHFHGTRLLAPDYLPATEDASLFSMFSVSDGDSQSNVALADKGLMPWWIHPQFRFQLLRPLAEITHWVDYKLWPETPFMMHLHSMIWLVAMLWMVLLFLRKFVVDSQIVNTAFVLFAVSANLSQVIIWLASRNTIMAATFGIAAVLLHVKSRETGQFNYRVYALMAFAAALASSEFGLGASTWLFAWTVMLDQGRLYRKCFRLLPYGLLMAGWAIIYVSYGHGTEYSDFYIDPVHNPMGYALALLERVPKVLFLSLTGLPPAFLGSLQVGGIGWIICVGFTALFFWLIKSYLRKPEWLYLLLGAMLSILPIAAGPSGGRTTAFVALGLLPMVALLFKSWITHTFNTRLALYQHRAIAWPLLFLALLGVLVTPASAALYRYNDHKNVLVPALNLPITEADADKNIVLLNPNSIFFAMMYPNYRVNRQLPLSQSLYSLASGQRDMMIKRDSETSLLVTPEGGFMVETQAFFVRPKENRFNPGDVVELGYMMVEPLSFTDDGRPLSIRFSFLSSVESDSIRILQCDQLQYLPFDIPEIGQTVTIPPCER